MSVAKLISLSTLLAKLPMAGFLGTSAIGGGLTTYYLFRPNDNKEHSKEIEKITLDLRNTKETLNNKIKSIENKIKQLEKASEERANFEEKGKCYAKAKKELDIYNSYNLFFRLFPLSFEDCEQYNKDNKFPEPKEKKDA